MVTRVQLSLISIEGSNMQQQQNKVLKFHLSCKIFIVLEDEIHCNMQLFLKAKTRGRGSVLSSKTGRNVTFLYYRMWGLVSIMPPLS